MHRVLITGAQGFVGRSLSEYLRSRGYYVIKADVASGADVNLDVTSQESVSSLNLGPLYAVIHLAAMTNIAKCVERPYECLRINCLGTLNMLEFSYRVGVKRFIYASSANVYGARPPLPVFEGAPLNPRTPYDYSKLLAENLVKIYNQQLSLPTVILRSWKLFGEYDSSTSVVSTFIDKCLRNEPLPLYNGGRDVTDPYHVENYCRAVELALKSEEAVGEAFNVGTGGHLSILELAELIRELTNSESELTLLPPRTSEENESMISYPSIEKIKKRLGYEPVVDLREGLLRVINYRRRLMGI